MDEAEKRSKIRDSIGSIKRLTDQYNELLEENARLTKEMLNMVEKNTALHLRVKSAIWAKEAFESLCWSMLDMHDNFGDLKEWGREMLTDVIYNQTEKNNAKQKDNNTN